MSRSRAEAEEYKRRRAQSRRQSNRDTRAWKLYWHLKRSGVTLDEARLWGDDEWAAAGEAAKLNRRNPVPSEATRAQTIGYLTKSEEP